MSRDCHMTSPDLKLLYLLMDEGQDIRIPTQLFLSTLHAAVPEFAHKDEKTGLFQQQDAHECWSALFTNLSQTLRLQSATPNDEVIFNSYDVIEVEPLQSRPLK